MKVPSSLLLTCLLFTSPAAPVNAQGPPPHLPAEALAEAVDPERLEWLTQHPVADGPVAGGLEFAFPDAFYQGRLFLLGESHGSAAPQVLDLELLTHLNARIGLTDYLAEVDPVQAVELNRYLADGDEAVLDRVFDLWNSGSQWANVAFEDKVRGIRALNATVPVDRRVRFHGVDAIQDWPLLVQYLRQRGAAIELDDVMGGAAVTERARIAADALAASSAAADEAYLLAALRRQQGGEDREGTIFGNYAELLRSGALGERPAYGLWGAAHVMQARLNGRDTFAARVRDSSLSSAALVRSIVVYALDSAVQFPVALPDGLARVRFAEGNVDGPVVKLAGSTTLREATRASRITLFALQGEGSPFDQGDELVALRSSMDPGLRPEPGLATTAYFQYVGVYRDSDWAAPRAGSGRVLQP